VAGANEGERDDDFDGGDFPAGGDEGASGHYYHTRLVHRQPCHSERGAGTHEHDAKEGKLGVESFPDERDLEEEVGFLDGLDCC
jgi:hypothetical protein